MRHIIQLMTIIIMSTLQLFGSAQNNLSITLTHIQQSKGEFYMAIATDEATYRYHLNNRQPISPNISDGHDRFLLKNNGKETQHFQIITPSSPHIAIIVFQDLNENRRLDRSFFWPIEPVGMSNNPDLLWGAPSFRDVMMSNVMSSQNVRINLR